MSDNPHQHLADELARALSQDLAEAPVATIDDDLQDFAAPPPPPSPTALKLDQWSLRRGKEWLKRDDVAEKTSMDANTAADFLSAAWDASPVMAANCVDQRRHQFMAQLLQTPEYKSLHRQTRLDDVASELAAMSFAQQYVALVKTEQPEDELDAEAQTQGACSKAIEQAKSDVTDLNNTRYALGLGGDGANPGSMSAQQVRELFARVKNNHQLRMITELAGRYRRMAQSIQASKPCHGQDEVVGIEYGDDISRIVPSELAMLADDDLEDEFLRRFAEGELQLEEMRAHEPVAKGPIVVVVDESGSMSGEPVAHAKAFALAMAWIARHQKRYCCLVGFSGGTEGNFLVCAPGTSDDEALMEWLEHFFGGGTTMDVPLDVLPEKWEELGCPSGETDIIMVTDAVVHVPQPMAEKFNAWRRAEQAEVSVIVMNDDPGDLPQVSDRHWLVSELGLDAAGVADCMAV